MILLNKVDDVYLSFSGDRSDMQELSDYFTFKIPGAEFTPAYRAKYWDGKIRLANLRDQKIYCGLIDRIAKFSEECNVKIDFEGSFKNIPGLERDISDQVIDGYLNILDPHSKGQPISLREYQYNAIIQAIRKRRMLLLSPTASGKSLVIYALSRFWTNTHNRKILIIVPTISLVDQMHSDFLDYSSGKWSDVAKIRGGMDKNPTERVIVSTWQSVHNLPKEWFDQFGSVVVDEVHHAQAKSIQKIMNNLTDCPDRIGLTGTLQDTKTHQFILEGLFASVYQATTTRDLIDDDTISDVDIRMINMRYKADEKKEVKNKDYLGEVDFIINHNRRLWFLCNIAINATGSTLVVFNRLEHGKRIFDYIQENSDKTILYVAGETKAEDREATRAIAEGKEVIIVASIQVFSTGINIKNLHNLIFAHPSKSKIKTLQSVGRILRKPENDQNALVYDLVDDLVHGQRKNFAFRHSLERFKYYTEEKFNLKIINIDI